MSELTPRIATFIQNDSGMDIPPRSVVLIASVELTPATDLNESIAIHHVKQYDGSAGNILVTGNWKIPAAAWSSSSSGDPPANRTDGLGWWKSYNSYGWAFSDQRLYVAIDPDITPPTPGEEWGPTSGKWYVTKGGKGFFADGYPSTSSSSSGAMRAIFMRGIGGSSSGSGLNGNCGCCSCFSCISTDQAIVGGCDACPDGAAYQYTANLGEWSAWPALGGLITLIAGFQSNACGSSSSSSSSSSSGSGCIWTSCLTTVSSEAGSGVYQWFLTMGVPSILELAFISGTDILDLTDNPVVYTSVADGFDCQCESKFKATNPAKFPSPDGLACEICLIPGEPLNVCCCNCFKVKYPSPGMVLGGTVGACSILNAASDQTFFMVHGYPTDPSSACLTPGGPNCMWSSVTSATTGSAAYTHCSLSYVFGDGSSVPTGATFGIQFNASPFGYVTLTYTSDNFDCSGGDFTWLSTSNNLTDCPSATLSFPMTIRVDACSCDASSSSSS